MANTFKFGNGNWAVKDGYALAYNDENNNFKPLPFDFTRASTATRVNKQGLVEVVPSGKPRIDFLDNTSGHLLLEPSRTNLMPTSEDFNGADWNRAALTIDSDDAISPYGTSTADKITFTGSGTLRTQNTFTFTNAYTYSIFVKKGNSRYVTLRSFAFTTSVIIGFDLDSVTAQTGGVIKQYPNDWFRLSISKDISSDADKNGYFYFYLPDSLGGTVSVNGNYAYIFGNQIEEGSYATSYIPTEGSSVTRVAETNSQTVADGVMGQTEGVMFLNTNITLGGRLMLLGATGNFIEVLSTAAGKINAFVYNGSTQANILSTSTYTSGDDLKIAFAYKANDFTLYINGVQEGSDTSGSIPTLSSNSLILNNYLTSGYDTKNSYSEAKLYNTRLTNTELQNLTS
jgi:hypothetical protein